MRIPARIIPPKPSLRSRLAAAIVVAGIVAGITAKRIDLAGDIKRDVIRNTVGFAPAQFYQALDLGESAEASSGLLTIAHNAGDRQVTAETALAFGADVIEVDVVALDGRLYAAHDRPNDRVGGYTFRGPSLESIWNVADGKSKIELDLKDSSPAFLRLLIAFLNDRGGGQDVIIATRSQPAIETLNEQLPDATIIYSVGDASALSLLMTRNDGLIGEIDGVSIRATLLNEETVDWLRDHDLLVLAWTVNDFATVDELLDLGVDGIATDNLAIIEHFDESTAIPE